MTTSATTTLTTEATLNVPMPNIPRKLSPRSEVVTLATIQPTIPMMIASMIQAMTRSGTSARATPAGPDIVPRAVRLLVHDGMPPPGGGAGCWGDDCQPWGGPEGGCPPCPD